MRTRLRATLRALASELSDVLRKPERASAQAGLKDRTSWKWGKLEDLSRSEVEIEKAEVGTGCGLKPVAQPVNSGRDAKGESMFEWLFTIEGWVSLATLTVLEIVLGIDNLVFLSIASRKLPADRRPIAQKLGLAGALVLRIIMPASAAAQTMIVAFGRERGVIRSSSVSRPKLSKISLSLCRGTKEHRRRRQQLRRSSVEHRHKQLVRVSPGNGQSR